MFNDATREDMVLCYVSGHGIKDDPGRLHLVTTDTEWDVLAVTALAATQLREMIDASRARQTVLWLDCCYSGAFPSGRSPKSGDRVDVVDQLADHSGRGCAVMTASTAIQYAFEGDADARATGPVQPSVFTDAIVRGLGTGAADLNSDGLVDANELYQYVYDEVKRSTPDQTPTRNDQVVGDLHIARSNRGLPVDPGLPQEIRQGLRSTMPRIRRAAVDELAELAKGGSTIAADTLERLSTHVDAELAQLALAALTPAPDRPTLSPHPKISEQSHALFNAPDRPERTADWLLLPAEIPIPTRPIVRTTPLAPPKGVRSRQRGGSVWRQMWVGTSDPSTTLARLDWRLVNSVVFSPDATLLVAVDDGGDVHGWLTDTWEHTLLDAMQGARQVAFSPRGDLIAGMGYEGLKVWRTEDWRVVQDIALKTVPAIGLSPDGALLVAATSQQSLGVWRTDNWQQVAHTSAVGTLDAPLGGISPITFSADGTFIATACVGSAILWRPHDGEVRTVSADKGKQPAWIQTTALSSDGALLAAGTQLGDVFVWHTKDLSLRARLRGHKDNITALAFSPDGRTLASAGVDHRIRLWNLADNRLDRNLVGHLDWVLSIAFSPEGSVLASGGKDNMVKLWDMTRQR